LSVQKILVTGSVGFIGFHICKALIENGYQIIGLDNISDYYSVELKNNRLKELKRIGSKHKNLFRFKQLNILDKVKISELFERESFSQVIHLAAQAGVRYSIDNPSAYVSTNIQGFFNVIDLCKSHGVQHFYYASSSSVYGNQTKKPFEETDRVDNPISIYAATKKTNELMAHTYSHLYGLETTALRFFTVYGPWGRPDMAPMIFLDALFNKKKIYVFNNGNLKRDFTYITDISEAIIRLIHKDQEGKIEKYRLFNIGNSEPILLLEFINILESITGRTFIRENMSMQAGDVFHTHACVNNLENYIGVIGHTSIENGLASFVAWFKKYYNH